MTQLNLLSNRRRDHDIASRCREAFLLAISDGRWHLRRDLCRTIPELTERACRQIAEASRGAVIGSAKGYKLTIHATVEELDHAERQLVSQANKMRERALEIRRARNRSGVAA